MTGSEAVLPARLTSPRHALSTHNDSVGAPIRRMLGATPIEVAPGRVAAGGASGHHWTVLYVHMGAPG